MKNCNILFMPCFRRDSISISDTLMGMFENIEVISKSVSRMDTHVETPGSDHGNEGTTAPHLGYDAKLLLTPPDCSQQ